MDSYFVEVVSSLSTDEILILGCLKDQDADKTFKAMKRSSVQEIIGLTDHNYRKALTKLETLKLISINSGGKEHHMHVNEKGIEALELNMEGEM